MYAVNPTKPKAINSPILGIFTPCNIKGISQVR